MSSGIIVVRDPKLLTSNSGPVVVTIGNFDGVHLGHQKVIQKLGQVAQGAVSKGQKSRKIVVSFYPHPSVVLRNATSLPLITPLRSKVALLSSLGVDVLLLLRFTPALAALTAAEFLDRYFCRALKATHVVLGPDTALGRNREGTRDLVTQYLQSHGVAVEGVSFHELDGDRVSSRRIRECITSGHITEANKLLGRNYSLTGRVLHGAGRGGTALGFPTANIRCPVQVIPKYGVYLTKVLLEDNVEHTAVTNIGVRPTFGVSSLGIESHLLSYSGDLYGRVITLQLIDRIRDERKFSSADELKAQITDDIRRAKELVSS